MNKTWFTKLPVLLALALSSPAAATPFTAALFDALDQLIFGGNGWKWYDGPGNYLSDSEGYVMRAYVQMYRATGNTYYMDKLIDHADSVIALRDDFADLPHEAPGNNPIWSGSFGLHSAPLTTGHVLQGLAQFARVVNEDPVLAANPTYTAAAATYMQRAQESVDWLNTNYLWDPAAGLSVYSVQPGDFSSDAPHVDATMGSVMMDMYHAGGDASLLLVNDRLAEMIQTNAFFTTRQGNQAWLYDYDAEWSEDFTHGAHAAPFLAHMAADERVFTIDQATGVARSVIEEAYLGDGQVTSGIDGTSPIEDRIEERLDSSYWSWGVAGGFIKMAQFDLRLLPIAEEVQLIDIGLAPRESGSQIMGVANLVRYAKVPQQAVVTLNVQAGGTVYVTATPGVATLAGATSVTLVNLADPDDVRQVSIELGGSGDEWSRLWDLDMKLVASGAADLIGATVLLSISLLDGNDLTTIIHSADEPAGFQLTQIDSNQARWNGTLSATQSFSLLSGERPHTSGSTTYVTRDDFELFAAGASILTVDPNWTLTGDDIPDGSTATATIANWPYVSGGRSLKFKTESDELLLRPHWNRDLSDAPVSVETPMTLATASLNINYNFTNVFSDGGGPDKSFPQDTWIYVTNDLGENVAQVRLNAGYYDWKFGLSAVNGATGSNVRNDDWHNLSMAFDVDAQTVSYFLDGVLEFVDVLPDPLLDGTAGFGVLRIENAINGPNGTEKNVTFVDDVFFSANIPACPADLDGDGIVGTPDLLIVLGAWGANPEHPADLNSDGVVGATDLLLLLGGWGPCG